jgi:DNA primase catalytic subunit
VLLQPLAVLADYGVDVRHLSLVGPSDLRSTARVAARPQYYSTITLARRGARKMLG